MAPVGLRFRPTDLGLVRLYLANKENSFITTMDIYKDEPWLLDHVTNPLFDNKVWYYFVPRSKRCGNTPNRTVPGRGGSQGGVWKSTSRKEEILDGEKKLMGFKQSLTYYQKSEHQKNVLKTDWLMMEYTLDKGHEFQDLVLCCIREKKQTIGEQPQPPETNNIVSNQLAPEEVKFADDLEAMLQGEHGGDTQQQEEETQFDED